MSLLGKIFGAKPDVMPTHIGDQADFDRYVVHSEIPVIVDVWSATCAPCRKLEPVLIKVATKYEGKVRVAEVSTEAQPELLAHLRVQATPTILVFDGGVEIGRMAGFRPVEWFDAMIATELLEPSE